MIVRYIDKGRKPTAFVNKGNGCVWIVNGDRAYRVGTDHHVEIDAFRPPEFTSIYETEISISIEPEKD